MVDRIVEVFYEGWFEIPFEDLKDGMLFRMYEPLSKKPVLYDNSDRWIVVDPPYNDGQGELKVSIRKYIELVYSK